MWLLLSFIWYLILLFNISFLFLFFIHLSDSSLTFPISYSRFCFLIHLHVSLFPYPAPIRFSDVLFTSLVLHLLNRFLIIWFFIYLTDSSFTCLVHHSFPIYHSLFLFLVQLSDSSFTVTVTRFPSNPFNSQTPPLSFCLPLSLLSSGLFSSSWKP